MICLLVGWDGDVDVVVDEGSRDREIDELESRVLARFPAVAITNILLEFSQYLICGNPRSLISEE